MPGPSSRVPVAGERFVADAMAADDGGSPANAIVGPVTGIDEFRTTRAYLTTMGATGRRRWRGERKPDSPSSSPSASLGTGHRGDWSV